MAPSSVTLITTTGSPFQPLLRGVASRLEAAVVDGRASPGLGFNTAVRSAGASFFIVLPAGFVLHDTFIEHCAMTLGSERVAAIAPSIASRSAEGIGELVWRPRVQSSIEILSDTRSVPPVFAIARDAWVSIGAFDETLEGLVEYDFWLRLVSAGHGVRIVPSILVSRPLEQDARQSPDPRHAEYFRAVLDRNRAVIERDMQELLIAREVRFGQLRTMHRTVLAQRDEELAELDRLRAESSHHRAYLEHHKRDAFDWGDFRRTDPVSRDWGYDRGGPIDRRYIDEFLSAHSSDVRGAVLEVQEDDFTLAYGGRRVKAHDVLDIDASNPRATVLADLRAAPEIASDSYDCVILTQTLHVIDDMGAALRECYRMLKPGGVLLATFPAASRVCLEYGVDGDYWRMTPAGARALLRETFAPAITSCASFGNVLTNTAFLHGLGASELTDGEFNTHDPYFPALTGIRAKKTNAVSPSYTRGAVLLYHRVDDAADVHGLGVPPPVFATHLQWLRRECHLLSVEDLLTTPNEDLPERAVAVTFDDGYLDNLTIAAPLLQQHQIPAAFFLTTRGLDEPIEYWWDTLERLVLHAPTPPLLDMNRAGMPLTFETRTAEQRQAAHWSLHDRLVHASVQERDRVIDWLCNWAGGGTPRVRPMTGDEVLTLLKLPGVTIGAHTVNHVALPDVADTRLVEMNDCRVELRRLTGQAVELFAYPYGAVDRETSALVRGFWRWGMSCDEGLLGDSFDAARVPRLDVKDWPEDEFGARVSRLFEAGPAR